MNDDVVIDTNVMIHADNPNDKFYHDSNNLLEILLEGDIKLCVDEGFDIDESKNRSRIACEYYEHLRFGSLGYAVLQNLSITMRIKFIDLKVDLNAKRKIIRLIRNKRDRTFLIVAFNSISRIFVSHDFEDFSIKKRDKIRSDFGVKMFIARDWNNLN